jgi:hypothetical protein
MLGDGQKCYTYQILLKEKCDYIINNKIIVRPANIDGNSYLSIFVFVVEKVTKQFGLTLEQYIELVYVIGIVSDPVVYSLVLLHWCKNKI